MNLQKKYINLRPAVLCSAGLILGILIAYLNVFINAYLGMLLFVIILLLGALLIVFKITRKKNLLALLLTSILLSFVIGNFSFLIDINKNVEVSGNYSFTGSVIDVLSEERIDNAYNYTLIIKGDLVGGERVKAYAKLTSTKRIYSGSSIWLDGYFTKADKYYALSLDISHFVKVENQTVSAVKPNDVISNIKMKLLLSFENLMPKTASLNYAVITGETEYVSNGVIQKYRDIGVAHLFAVSGLHIGLMYGVVLALSKLLKLKPKLRLFITLFILFLYLLFCGFSVSSIRAFIIIAIREIALNLGLKSDKTSNLAVSAFIVLIINPCDLFSAGFLLSYSVYLGLILLTSPCENFLSKFLHEKLSKLLSPCLVAQTVSFPILISFFGYASPFSFLFNMVTIPYIAVLYPLILLSAILILIFPTVWVFSIIPNLSFLIIEWMLGFIKTDIFMIKNLSFSYSVAPYYMLLYSFTGKLNFSVKTFKLLRIILLLAFLILFLIINFNMY